MNSGDNNSQNKDLMYRRCPYCESLIKANSRYCPVCGEKLNPRPYQVRLKQSKQPRQKEQHWEQQDIKEMKKEDGCNKGCIAWMVGIATFIGAIFLITHPLIILIGFLILLSVAIGSEFYDS